MVYPRVDIAPMERCIPMLTTLITIFNEISYLEFVMEYGLKVIHLRTFDVNLAMSVWSVCTDNNSLREYPIWSNIDVCNFSEIRNIGQIFRYLSSKYRKIFTDKNIEILLISHQLTTHLVPPSQGVKRLK